VKPLPILFAVAAIDVVGFGMLIPLIPYMGERFGASPSVITAILGTYSLCQFIAAPAWGRLSDRYGRRPILLWSLAGACVSYAILGFADGLGALLVSRVLGGFMAGNIAAAFAYASDVSEPEHRAAAIGTIGAALGIGFTIGPAIGGLLAGEDPATANFLRPALVAIALTLVAMALIAFVLPESHTAAHRAASSSAPEPTRPFALLRARPRLRRLSLASLLVTASQSMLQSIFAIWALDRFGYGPRTVGLLLFVLALVPVFVQGVLVRSLAPRLGEERLAQYGALASIAGLVTVGLATGAGATMLGLALCGAGGGAFSPSTSALASKEAGAGNRGAVLGTFQAANSLARVIGPFASGPLYSLIGPAAPFLIGAIASLPAPFLLRRRG
jgi:DHA1 family tetracycline resistance protein-like MFS transporter